MDAAVNETKDRLEAKLRYELGYDIVRFLDDDDVYEVDVNGDGKIWVIKAGGHPSGEYSGYDLPFPARMSFLGTIAFMADKELNDKNPKVEGILPWNGARVTGVIPPSNLYGPNICIRKKATKIFSLQEYIDNDRMTLGDKEIIENAIRNKKNIVIAGPTGSGKTTFTNAIIDSLYLISPTDRILCLEDVAEIQVRHENKVCLKTTDEMTLEKLVKTAMRLTPDRIVIGEVRGKEALDLLTAWNTGHPGGVTTIHANSSRETLKRLETLVRQSSQDPLRDMIGMCIDLILYIQRLGSRGPVLTEILEVTDYDELNMRYELNWLKKKEQSEEVMDLDA